jgi:heme A synthase
VILSHFTALVVFAIIVSTVFALITKNEPREQFRYGVFVFLTFLAVAIAVGWLMYPLPL